MTPKGQTCDPNTLRVQYRAKSWRCYLATIANYKTVCCEAVRSAILSTAWLLVILGITLLFLWFWLYASQGVGCTGDNRLKISRR